VRTAVGAEHNSLWLVIRYGLVGAAVALIYIVSFKLLQIADLFPAVINSCLAFLIAVAVQYLGHAAITFRRTVRDGAQAVRFALTVGMGMVLSAIVVGCVGPALGIRDHYSALAVIVIVPFFNFIVFKVWAFAPGRRRDLDRCAGVSSDCRDS
jgi:putative flippase GtrA